MSDSDTIARILRGDQLAFRSIVESHQALIIRFVRAMIADHTEAEDVAQDTFLAAYRNLAQFDERRGSLRVWLLSIARNKSINVLKRRKTELRGDCDLMATPAVDDPSIEAVQQEMFQRLDRALAELPDDLRSAFLLFQQEGLRYDEIAALEGIELGTVKSRISRARQRLRNAVTDFLRVET